MRVVFADCSVTYSGRLDARLPRALRVLMLKADGSVLVHADGGSYKPLNWMSPPCNFSEAEPEPDAAAEGATQVWKVAAAKADDVLTITIYNVVADVEEALGVDPGLEKDGVEAHLQELLAEQVELIGQGVSLVRREYPTAIGPVDLLVRNPEGGHVAVEVKRRGEIDGVEQLTRYLELLNRDPLLAPVTGVFAAQVIKPQARVLAADRGIGCLLLDYAAMRGVDDSDSRLF
ncbi:endonuclease NucS [Buchananella felis]|uniref:endonuclease NucS n=1 Tax=Buchananella felis TaxID=3231492 RepID=UPI0035277825